MRLKKFSIVFGIVGLILAAFGFMPPLFMTDTEYMKAFGNSYNGLLSVLATVGITFIITASFCLVFKKTVTRHCTVKTSLVSLSISHVGTLGIICFFMWMSMAAFGEASRHPIQYPFTVCVGMLSLMLFLMLIAVYLYIRHKTPSFAGFLIDVVTAVIYMPAAFTVISYVMLIAEKIF